jgi:hypothetical protein
MIVIRLRDGLAQVIDRVLERHELLAAGSSIGSSNLRDQPLVASAILVDLDSEAVRRQHRLLLSDDRSPRAGTGQTQHQPKEDHGF